MRERSVAVPRRPNLVNHFSQGSQILALVLAITTASLLVQGSPLVLSGGCGSEDKSISEFRLDKYFSHILFS
jgi:hypothetical protein